MTSPIIRATSRRRFLQYLAGSPLLASGALSAYGTEAPSKLPDPMIWAPQNLEELYPKFFGNAAAGAKQMKLIWLAAGDEDFALNGTKMLDEILTKNAVRHSFKTTQGRHEWRLWRPHLYEFAQLLFRDVKS